MRALTYACVVASLTVAACEFPRMTFSDAAVVDAAGTDGQAIDAQATDAQATDAPATDAPATDAAATDAPATDAPATDALSTDAPATDAPATDASWDPIPPDVITPLRMGSVTWVLPPSGWSSAGAWIHLLHDSRLPGPSSVDVEFVELYAGTGASSVPLAIESPTMGTGLDWLKTVVRVPWYSSYADQPFNSAQPTVTFLPGADPTRFLHTGGLRATAFPPGMTHCWMRARVHITGPALVQGGIDYWNSPSGSSNVRAGASDWYVGAGTHDIIFDLSAGP